MSVGFLIIDDLLKIQEILYDKKLENNLSDLEQKLFTDIRDYLHDFHIREVDKLREENKHDGDI